jgi:hypothetical protein
MKKLLLFIAIVAAMPAVAQECGSKTTGTVSLAWGADAKMGSGVHAEGGVWYLAKIFTLEGGVSAWSRPLDEPTKEFGDVDQKFFEVYARAGIVTWVNNSHTLFTVASVTASSSWRPQASYSLYIKPIPNTDFLVGVMPFYEPKAKTGGAWLQLKFSR